MPFSPSGCCISSPGHGFKPMHRQTVIVDHHSFSSQCCGDPVEAKLSQFGFGVVALFTLQVWVQNSKRKMRFTQINRIFRLNENDFLVYVCGFQSERKYHRWFVVINLLSYFLSLRKAKSNHHKHPNLGMCLSVQSIETYYCMGCTYEIVQAKISISRDC